MLNAKLVIVGGESKATEVKLKFPCIIGRGKGSTLLLRHPLVSRQHCELFESNGQLMARDLGSLNGTYVNNEKIEEAIVPAGHLLTIGSVTFRAVYDAPVPGPDDARKTDVVFPNQAPVVAEPLPFDPDEAVPEAEEFDFDAIAQPEEGVPASAAVSEEPAPEPENFNFDVELEDESEGISSEPLFAPDPPAKPTVPKIVPPKPAAKAPAPVAKPAAPAAKPVAKPIATKPTPAAPAQPSPAAEEEEVDEDLDDFLKSLNM